jgi:hypothetical protein
MYGLAPPSSMQAIYYNRDSTLRPLLSPSSNSFLVTNVILNGD